MKFLIVLLLIFECSTKNKLSNVLDNKSQNWILSNYLDSIITYRSISRFSIDKMCYSSVLIKIENDTITLNGLVNWNLKHAVNYSKDSFYVITNFGNFVYKYESDYLLCFANNKTYKYIKVVDSSLIKLKSKHDFKLFINKRVLNMMFTGTYLSIDKSTSIKMDEDNNVIGFKNFSKFYIHDYIGTYNPFKNFDAIKFIDTSSLNNNLEKNEIYKWEFHNDTLVLNKFKFVNENYELTDNVIKFLKVK